MAAAVARARTARALSVSATSCRKRRAPGENRPFYGLATLCVSGGQGLAAAFIERIDGSHSGIMGLPLFETANLLKQVGVNTGLGV